MKSFLLLFVVLISTYAFSQQETYNWYFGLNAGITFATNPPSYLPGSQMGANEGCASLSDSNGNLLFYSNGNVIWDRNHNIMPNGTGLNGSLTCTQSALFTPWPGNDSLYFLFTPPDQFNTTGSFCYSIVDMTLNNSYGDITNKNTPLFSPSTEKVTAVLHANGTDIWVIGHSFNNADFYAYLITSAGINITPVISTAGTVHGGDDDNNLGTMKASPCGDKIALVVQTNFAELFDFDNATGIVSNPVFLGDYSPFNAWGLYAAEFSPGGTKLYLTQENPAMLVQYDLLAGSDSAIAASADTIVYLPTKYFGSMQLGPDGKIYIARFLPATPGDFLSCINQPENTGSACDFIDMSIVFNSSFTGASHGLPNFMSGYFCSTPASPNANFTAVQNILCDSVCIYFTDSTSGDPTSWQWNFPGATTTSSFLQNPTACYTQSGTYPVHLISCNTAGCDSVTINYTVIIQHPSVSLGNDTSICAGDTIQIAANTGYLYYEWQHNFMPVDSGINILTANLEGNYSITVTDSNGCKAHDTIYIEFATKPEAAFNYNYELNCEGLNVQFINESINANNYQWNFSDGTYTTEIHPQQEFNLSQHLAVQLISYNGGCTDTFVLENLFFENLAFTDIPTIFTPNTDGFNDCFEINSLTAFQSCLQMQIYNRWGELVYERSDAMPCWKGLNKAGIEVSDGVYFVVLTLHEFKYAGALHLLR